ncbi:MAG: ABC transporter permease [Halorientalis sp.]
MASFDPLADVRWAIARRDLRSLSREKTIVLALLIQLFVAAFSSFLVVGLTSLYNPASVSGQVEVGVTGGAGDALTDAAREVEGVNAVTFPTNATAREAFRTGRVDALVIAERTRDSDISVVATAPDSSIRTTVIVVQLQQLLEAAERLERRERAAYIDAPLVPLPPDVSASPYFAFTYTILVPLLLFLPPFISGSVAVDSVTEEIERGTLELLRVAPVTLTDVVDGKAAAMAVLAPAQALLWLGLLAANGIAVSNPVALVALVSAVSVIVVALGVTLGLVLRERRSAQLLYSTGVLALFGAAVFLPEHPATTVAKLAVGSPTATTYGLVGLYAVLAVGFYGAARAYVRRVNPEAL